MPEPKFEIVLSFHNDGSLGWPRGYWAADARPVDWAAEYTGVGATPLDAMMALASEMYEDLKKQS